MSFIEKLQQFIYDLSTQDKYSEFDPRKSFNRVNKPDSTNLLTSYDITQNHQQTNVTNNEGVYEVRLAWRHIKNWLSRYSPDLLHSLQSKCTNSDLEEFQKDLNISLPRAVLEFFKLTDGQSNFGDFDQGFGLIFGLKLMSLDEIMIMTENWRKIASVFNSEISQIKQSVNYHELAKLPTSHINTINKSSEMIDMTESISSETRSSVSSSPSDNTLHFNIPKQRSIPPGTIHETFAHPMWIPIITDEVGNYIGVDLSPPPQSNAKYGQVILFGREFDFKFQIADNWGDFLLIFANDLEIGNWDIKRNVKNNDGDLFIGNEGELVYFDKISKLEIPYLEVLKSRTLKKWINSLGNQDDSKQLLEELNNSKVSILSINQNFTSVDGYINNNLSVIDSVEQRQPPQPPQPPQPQQYQPKTSPPRKFKKSPLSQDISQDIWDNSEDNSDDNSDDTLQEIDITK